MLAIDRGAGVLQFLEVPYDLIQTDPPHLRHGSSSVGRRKGSDTENDRQTIIRRELDPGCRVYPELPLALPTLHGARRADAEVRQPLDRPADVPVRGADVTRHV